MTDILNIDPPEDTRWVDRTPEPSLRLLIETRDWAAAGRLLVERPAVPGMLATGRHPLLTRIEVAEAIGDAEPLILAAVALGRCWPEVAAVAIERAEQDLGRRTATIAEQLSLAVLKMAAARSRAQPGPGRQYAQQVLELMPRLSLGQRDRVPELLPMVESHLGLFALWEGAPDRALAAFGRGARGCRLRPAAALGEESAVQLVVADCVGQQAFLEAVAGELGTAIRHAADVLTARPADSTERGVVHAQLATVWVHAARGELAQARQRFDSVSARTAAPGDEELRPGLAAAVALTGARLTSITGDARIGRDLTELCRYPAVFGFFADQSRLIRAEAELTAGRPARALQLLAEGGTLGSGGQLLRARASLAQGDPAASVAALRVRLGTRLSLLDQVQQELLEARLAPSGADPDRRRALISRALRTAEREQLRTPLRWAGRWLRSVVGADAVLHRRHGAFVASIRPAAAGADAGTIFASGPVTGPGTGPATPPVAPLTRRELDILQRLAGMSTNEEIAGELFLSTNTIKTHLKSLYRKLDVARRSDAVRHGRALGLC